MAPDIVSKPIEIRRVRYSIGFKITVVNIVALLILGIGVIAFSEYRRALVYTEVSLLQDEARLWATSFSQTAPDDQAMMARALVQASPRQLYYFDAQGKLLIKLGQDLPAKIIPMDEGAPDPVFKPLIELMLFFFPVEYSLPDYPVITGQHISDFPPAMVRVDTADAVNAWVGPMGQLVYTAVAPVVKENQAKGTLVLVKNQTQTQQAFEMARIDLVRIFLAALAITLTITLYVAFVIARPLNEMARAAEKMRDLKLRVQLIPDWRDRGDEIGVLSGVLRDTTEALRTRLDSIEGFAADVTHELKNPLTSLRSALETLPRIEDPNKRHQLLIIMREDTERLDRLITDIAKASRLDSELSREALYAVSLPEVFIHILRGFSIKPDMVGLPLPEQLITRYQDIRIVISGIDKMPPVAGNALRLQQIFDNILANAISFSPQGGVVMIRASLIDQYIRLEIEDQGPGIPKGKTETIFDRFYSERPSGEAFGMHSGLGLSIVRQIVMALNGRVWAENITTSDGRVQGACFIVEIPIFQDLT